MVEVLDAYLKNGELFLKSKGMTKIDGETIRKTYLWPIEEMSGVAVENDTDAVAILRRFGFELSGKTSELLPSFFKTSGEPAHSAVEMVKLLATRPSYSPLRGK